MKKCPFCAEEIQDEAVKCRFCGEFLENSSADSEIKWYFKPLWLLIWFVCIGPFALIILWWHPTLGRDKKILITVIVTILSIIAGIALWYSIRSITRYYQMIFDF